MTLSAQEREEFTALQEKVKPLLLGQSHLVVIWALLDLVYFVSKLPQMYRSSSEVARLLRGIADLVEKNSD